MDSRPASCSHSTYIPPSTTRSMRSERVENDLGATAGLRYRNARPRTSVTERVSGGGEPHPERSDQRSAVTLRRRKSHLGGDRSPAASKITALALGSVEDLVVRSDSRGFGVGESFSRCAFALIAW